MKGVRFVAGLGVAHLPCHLTAERVHHVKRLAAALPEDAADAALVHEPRHMRHDDVPFWGHGAVVARIPRHPKGRARLLELHFFVLAQQPICAAARYPSNFVRIGVGALNHKVTLTVSTPREPNAFRRGPALRTGTSALKRYKRNELEYPKDIIQSEGKAQQNNRMVYWVFCVDRVSRSQYTLFPLCPQPFYRGRTRPGHDLGN